MNALSPIAPRGPERAARLAVGAAVLALLLFAAVHVLRPDVGVGDHMISEYALGAHGWVMSTCFASFAVSTASLFAALARHTRTRLGRVGLAFLPLATVGLVLGALFRTDPATTTPDAMSLSGRLHALGFMIGVPGELFASLLLSLTLRNEPAWPRRVMLSLAGAIWLSIAVMAPLVAARHGFGIPNRTFMVFFGVWLVVVAWPIASRRARISGPGTPPDAVPRTNEYLPRRRPSA